MTDNATGSQRWRAAMMDNYGTPKLTLVRGQGCEVTDADGTTYVDFVSGIAVNALGHAHPAIVSAVTEQIGRLGHVSNFYAHEPGLELAEQLPGAQILNEDGSNRDFLLSEGLESTEAFVALTNIDEENVLLTLFAKKHSKGKLVTKINRLEFDDILAGLDLGSIVYPKYMTCDYIVQYVRALQNEAGNNIKTLYRILDDRVEALEFTVHEESRATGVPLSQLHLKKNLLLCCITRGDNILIPRGGDQIQVGDNVIVVTLEHGLHDLRDIVEE